MKITDIKAFPVQVGGTQLVVKVETDAGIHGVGEAGIPNRFLAVVGAIRHYREFLLGRDPMRIGALWQEMYRSQYFEGGRILTAAIAAIDIALHDIAGKALGVPVYQGNRRLNRRDGMIRTCFPFNLRLKVRGFRSLNCRGLALSSMRSLHLPILRGLSEHISFAGVMDRLLTDRRFVCTVYCTFGDMLRET